MNCCTLHSKVVILQQVSVEELKGLDKQTLYFEDWLKTLTD